MYKPPFLARPYNYPIETPHLVFPSHWCGWSRRSLDSKATGAIITGWWLSHPSEKNMQPSNWIVSPQGWGVVKKNFETTT